jgi:hypothetical protein
MNDEYEAIIDLLARRDLEKAREEKPRIPVLKFMAFARRLITPEGHYDRTTFGVFSDWLEEEQGCPAFACFLRERYYRGH